MKLFLPAALLASAASASAGSVIRGDAARKLMAQSVRVNKKLDRRLEDEDAEEEEAEDDYEWMANYKVKFVQCNAGYGFANAENGEYEQASIIYRLCASDGECDDESAFGCEEAYGDYIVGINTYVQAYAEALEQQQNQRKLATSKRRLGDEFELQEFAECGRIDIEDDENDNGDEDAEDVEYYVGPACSEDGSDIVLSLFADEDCAYSAGVDFYDLAGQNLPYYDGGIASPYCSACGAYNNNNEFEVSEFCMRLGEASSGCDENDQSQCESIEELTAELRADESKSNAGKIILWIIVALVIVGIGFFLFKKQQQKKAASGVDNTPLGTSAAMS